MPAYDILALIPNSPGAGQAVLRVPGANDTYNLPVTFNSPGVAMTALSVNVTDTASAAASLLADFQVGGSSRLRVDKRGQTVLTGTGVTNVPVLLIQGCGAGTGAIDIGWAGLGTFSIHDTSAALNMTAVNKGPVRIQAAGAVGSATQHTFVLEASPNPDQGQPLFLISTATPAPNARWYEITRGGQLIYNTFTDPINYERGFARWSSNEFQIGTERAGSGSARALHFVTNGTSRANFDANGNFVLGSGSTFSQFGSIGFNYFGSNQVNLASFVPLLWSSGALAASPDTGLARNAAGVVEVNNGTAGQFRDLRARDIVVNGRVISSQSANGGLAISDAPSSTNFLEVVNGTLFCHVNNNIIASINRSGLKGFSTTSDGFFSWGSSTTASGNPGDLVLYRDAANTLAQRNSTNPQTFHLYRSFVDNDNRGYTALRQDATDGLVINNVFLGSVGDTSYALQIMKNGTSLFKIGANGAICGGGGVFHETLYVSGNQTGGLDSNVALGGPAGQGVAVRSIGMYGFSSSAQRAQHAIVDTGLARNAAGVVEVNNGTAGTLRDLRLRSVIQALPASITPSTNGDYVVEATSNTTLTFKLRGSDGTVRSATLALS